TSSRTTLAPRLRWSPSTHQMLVSRAATAAHGVSNQGSAQAGTSKFCVGCSPAIPYTGDMTSTVSYLGETATRARTAARLLARVSRAEKDAALRRIAEILET